MKKNSNTIIYHMLTYEKLNTVEVKDPRICVNQKKDFAILRGGSQLLYKQYTSTSISNSQISWSAPPPSGNIFLSKVFWCYLPFRLTFTGRAPIGIPLIQSNRDAPRAWPINGSTQNATVTINGVSSSIAIGSMIHALRHFNTDLNLENGKYSTTPNMADESQQYSDIYLGIRSPLSAYADGIDGTSNSRGGFSFTVVSNPLSTNPAVDTTAIVDMCCMEPIFCPPLGWGGDEEAAFYNITTVDIVLNFYNNLGFRMWSHDDNGGTNNISNIQCNFGGTVGGPTTNFPSGNLPTINFTYITPKETEQLGPLTPTFYDYSETQKFVTQLGSFATQTSQTVYSNNIQLNSVPFKIYIYVREQENVLTTSCNHTDTFFRINSASFQYFAENGIMSSASPQTLYNISATNGCNMSYTQWYPTGVYSSGGIPSGAGPFAPTVFTNGSVLCVNPSYDFGLDSLTASGKLVQNMLQVQLNVTNISGRTITPELYIIPIFDGVFSVNSLANATKQIGVITSKDILDASSKPGINYDSLKSGSGGNMFTGLKTFFTNKVMPFARNFVDNQGISTTLGVIPHPAAKMAGLAAKMAGYGNGGVLVGNGGVMAGSMAGGKSMSRKSLADRMDKY